MIEGTVVDLRALEMDDLDRCYRWINDREVTRFLAMRYQVPYAAEESWLRDRVSRPMSFTDRVIFAIVTKDGRHIGNCDIFDASPEERKASVGIMIGEKDCWSQGYGTGAMLALLRFAFDEMNLNRIELRVYAFNERAIRCYEKCGFVREVVLREEQYIDGAYHDALLMGCLRDEFYALHGRTEVNA